MFADFVNKLLNKSKKAKYKFFKDLFGVDNICGFIAFRTLRRRGYSVAEHLQLSIDQPRIPNERYYIKNAYITPTSRYILLIFDNRTNCHYLAVYRRKLKSSLGFDL